MKIRPVTYLCISLLLLTSCMGASESSIQGTWEYSEEHLMPIAGEQHLTVIWFFNNGTFSYQACCFNVDQEITGRYRILEEDGDILILELYNTRGASFRLNTEIRVKIDRESDTLNIQGAGPFHRLGP